MTALTVAKKRKLNKREAKVVAALSVVINYLKKDYGEQVCGEYSPDCPACKFYVTKGHIEMLKSHIEY